MRRFWAHLVIAFTALVSIASTVALVGSKTSGNVEYLDGREIIFRVSSKNGSNEVLDADATDKIVDVMNERLKNSDVSYYSIEKADVGNKETDRDESFVKVQLRCDTGDLSYDQIAFYLTFNGSLALTDNADDYALFKDFMTGPAYYEAYNQFYPAIVIPIDNTPNGTFDTLYNTAKTKGTPEEQTSGEGEEAQTNSAIYLYTWYDFNPEHDSYNKTQETLPDGSKNPEYNENVAKKLLNFSFKVTDDECFYPNDENKNKLFAVLNITQSEDTPATMDDAKAGFITARYVVNLFNSSELDYKVEAVNTSNMKIVSPLIENIKNQDQTLAWSRTFIATLCAVLILSLLIAVFYRLSAISICTVSITTVFLTFLAFLGLGAEFNTAAIVGFILVALASLASGVLYANRLKEECYKGRTLKKANSEAARKTLFPIVDIHLVPIVIGGFMYLFGGILFRSFGLICILGGLISAGMNLVGLRGMMWLSTNTTKFIGKYHLFGVEPDKVANHLDGEKQSYFGPYQNKDFTKRKKLTSIICGVLFAAGLTGIIVFGSINSGHLFNSGNLSNNSEIYLTYSSREETANPYDEKYAKELLNNVYVFDDDPAKANKLANYVTDFDKNFENNVTQFTFTDVPENSESQTEITIYYFYYLVKLNQPIDGNVKKAYYSATPIQPGQAIPETDTLNAVLRKQAEVLSTEVADSYVYLDTYKVIDIPNWSMIALGSFVASAVLTFYFCLRYRLSRGLTSIIAPFVSSVVGIGFFSLLRIVAPVYIVAGIPIVIAFTYIISIFFMEKERDLLLEDRTRDNSVEAREALMKRSTSLAFTPILVFSILAIYLAINFFGFGAKGSCEVFLVAIIGMLLSSFMVVILYGPIASIFYKWFHKIGANFSRPSKPKKNSNKPVKKSAEPEEAIFIGIND